MISEEIENIKQEIQFIKQFLNYHVSARRAAQKGLPVPEFVFPDSFLFYEKEQPDELMAAKKVLENRLEKLLDEKIFLMRGANYQVSTRASKLIEDLSSLDYTIIGKYPARYAEKDVVAKARADSELEHPIRKAIYLIDKYSSKESI
eukprot:scaffold1942_cov323-Ochromonas_danica.AAC.1